MCFDVLVFEELFVVYVVGYVEFGVYVSGLGLSVFDLVGFLLVCFVILFFFMWMFLGVG